MKRRKKKSWLNRCNWKDLRGFVIALLLALTGLINALAQYKLGGTEHKQIEPPAHHATSETLWV